MKTKLNQVKIQKWMAAAGILVLTMVMMVMVTPVKVEAASRGIPTKVCIPKKTNKKVCVSVNLRWKSQNGADGYVIYRSTSKYGKYRQISDVKSNGILAYSDSTVKDSKVYYYKVRAYKNKGNRKIFAQFTSLKFNKVIKNVTKKQVSVWANIKKFFS